MLSGWQHQRYFSKSQEASEQVALFVKASGSMMMVLELETAFILSKRQNFSIVSVNYVDKQNI